LTAAVAVAVVVVVVAVVVAVVALVFVLFALVLAIGLPRRFHDFSSLLKLLLGGEVTRLHQLCDFRLNIVTADLRFIEKVCEAAANFVSVDAGLDGLTVFFEGAHHGLEHAFALDPLGHGGDLALDRCEALLAHGDFPGVTPGGIDNFLLHHHLADPVELLRLLRFASLLHVCSLLLHHGVLFIHEFGIVELLALAFALGSLAALSDTPVLASATLDLASATGLVLAASTGGGLLLLTVLVLFFDFLLV